MECGSIQSASRQPGDYTEKHHAFSSDNCLAQRIFPVAGTGSLWHDTDTMPSLEQIKASAGSGKTYTLTRRFLTLLREALPSGGPSLCTLSPTNAAMRSDTPEYSLAGILAATFTNKAAAEMQARVIKELKQQALVRDGELATEPSEDDFPLSPAEARRWMGAILRRFDSVNIRTIDSLLTLLVRLNALSLSLPPDFTPVFSLEDILSPLYDEVLDRASSGDTEITQRIREACQGLLRHGGVSGLFAKDMLYSRLGDIIRLHLAGHDLPKTEDAKAITATLVSRVDDVVLAATALDNLAEEASCAFSSNAATFLSRCGSIQAFRLPAFSDTYATKTLEEWTLKASRAAITQDIRDAHADLAHAYAALKRDGKLLLSTLRLLPLVCLAMPLLDALDAIQRDKGLVPAERLCSLALASLSGEHGVSDAFCRLGDRLTHLLFDEFQDTSTEQWLSILPLAIESLSRGGSLTYVGDVKQAIYGWRGGNAELFDAVARDANLTVMLENGPKSASLPHNWRSAPAVVAFNNAMFTQLADPAIAAAVAGAMAPKATATVAAEAARMIASAFTGAEQLVPDKNREKPGFVRLQRIEESGKTATGEAVHNAMRDLFTGDLLTRRNPGDIAVLVRKNDEAAQMAEWLTAWHVPVVTEQSFCLGAHPLITRLVDMLTFLEYPMNDTAFWSAISGPELFPAACRLPDAPALAEWLVSVRERAPAIPLYALFREDFPRAWEQIAALFFDQAGLLSAYDMVREMFTRFALGERYPSQLPFLRRFAEVVHAAEDAGHSSLSAFLDFWNEKGFQERVPMPESMNAVRILTMHKAKGLEFPVVVVPYHHSSDPARQPLASLQACGFTLLAERPRDGIEAVRSVMEQLNLLYVAWTRPTEELYAFITGKSTSSGLSGALGIMLESLPFKEGVHTTGCVPDASPATQADTQTAAPPTPATPPKMDENAAQLMAWLPRLKIFRNPTDDSGFSERQRGLLAHACLGVLTLTGSVRDDVERAVRQGLRVFPVPMPDPEAVRRDMLNMLLWYASLPDTPDRIRYGTPEQPIMDASGAMHRVDLLVDKPGSPLLAVEYKTGQPSPNHAAQVSRYLSLLAPVAARMEQGRGTAGVIVYLDLRTCIPITASDSSPGDRS